MFNKKVLSEQFVITHKVSNLLKINKKKLLTNAIKNYALGNRLSNEDWYSDYNYVHLSDHQHLAWLHDYIRDHYRGEYNATPIMIKRGAIVLLKNESLGSHHHINEWDYKNSPEISVLYCLTKEEKNLNVIFEYEFGRNKKLRWKENLEENKLIIFPSYLKHFIPKNINDKAMVVLSFQFQLL
jgi:hypothetical protein